MKKGFTLIELLVVIAIIAILAAILFPVFAKVREKARQTQCISNEKQIGMAVMQYVNDYDEDYPPSEVIMDPTYTNILHWQNIVYPYIKSTNVFKCPSNPMKDVVATWEYPKGSANPIYPAIDISYAANARILPAFNFNNGPNGSIPVSMASVNAPSQKVMVYEVQYWDNYFSPWAGNPPDSSFYLQNPAAPHSKSNDVFFAGHTGLANYLFGDGHCKTMKPVNTATPYNMWGGLWAPTPVCSSIDINCDQPEPVLVTAMQQVQQDFQ